MDDPEVSKSIKACERHLRSIADCLRVVCALGIGALAMAYYLCKH